MNEEEIFQIAAEMPAAARAAYIATACERQPELRQRIERLLASHDHDAFMERSADRNDSAELGAELARLKPEKGEDRIGNYKLLQELGEGGFGTVWMAEQLEPVRRRVALKIVKPGMDSKEVIVRFEQERQALALMDHPNIAKVLDAGVTPLGRPFFVMELVRGIRITDYCDQNNLRTAERLDLFIAVCNAIQHAHQKGIIHRDIKPSNILVTLHDGVPVPKVIDFGVAKAIQSQRLTDLTFFTRFEQMIGTPLYMSPEQAEMSGLDIDTRSDIYSLGVLLYELLTGRTPFDPEKLMKQGLNEMRRAIREEEPPKPSTFVSTMAADARTTVAQHRQVDSVKLFGQIRGDLDWIVMKCLEKDRSRRYDTANGLAVDLKRHLSNEPVIARPPTAAYKLQKAWRRNKLAFSASTAVGVALLVGASLSLWQASVARREKTAAQRQLYVANMFSALPAWEENNIRMVRQLLADTRDSSDRGFEWYYWQRQIRLNLRTLYGHVDKVNSVAFFPDGQRIVTGSEDKSARVWDIATGAELLRLRHNSSVNSVAVSSDGKQIATTSDQTVTIWDASSGRDLLLLNGHGSAITALSFSTDGQRIVTGSSDGIGRIWEVATQRVLVLLKGHTSAINSVAFSPDGEKVATASMDGTARVWRSSDGSELFPLTGHSREIMAVAFSPDGRKILTGSLDQSAQFWDARTGAILPLRFETTDPMTSLAFSQNGRRIVTGSWSSMGRVWNATNDQMELLIRGHERAIKAVAISPDGTRVVTAGVDSSVKVWDANGGREEIRVGGNPTNFVLAVAISPNGKRVATGSGTFKRNGSVMGSGNQALQVWDSNTKENLLTISGHSSGVSSVAFSPNGAQILSGSGDHTAKLWDAASGGLLSTFTGHTGSVTSVAFFPDGKRIVTGSQDRTARVWNLATGRELVLSGHMGPISSVAVSPNGKWIATGSFDETARVWEAATGQLVRTITGRTSLIYSVAFSPDNRRLAIGGWEPPTVWDLEDANREPITLQGHGVPVSSIVFSRDGLRIVTGSRDGMANVKIWQAASGRELLTLRGHTQYVYSVAFSVDGLRIVTGSGDRTARIWEAATTNQVDAWELEERAAAEAKAAWQQQLQ
jgi:WD40 repeat protein/serine/threonine protein kinase